jgi:MFS family permease
VRFPVLHRRALHLSAASVGSLVGNDVGNEKMASASITTSVQEPIAPAAQPYACRAVFFVCLVCALSDMNFSMLMAFFPAAASSKGVTPRVTGVLFGLSQLFALLSTPFAPTICTRLGGARVLLLALILQGSFAVAFAFTGLATTTLRFVICCAALRAGQGVCAGLTEVAGIGLLMRSVPPDKASDAVGWSEAARGIGIMIGPVLGGSLDSLVGYEAPFLSAGGALLLCALVMLVAPIPVSSVTRVAAERPMSLLLGSPVVLACLLVIFSIMFAIAFLDPAMQPFLSQPPYRLPESLIGLCFTAALIAYTALSIVAGSIASRLGNVTSLVSGLSLAGLAYLTMAPLDELSLPLTPFPFLSPHGRSQAYAIGLAVGSIVLLGAGCALAFVPANALMIEEGRRVGLSVEQSSDAIAALAQLAFTSGSASGPMVSGALVQALGFPRAAAACGLTVIGNALLLLIVVTCVRRRRHRRKMQATAAERMHERLLEGSADSMVRGGAT